jgi:hypothetical protein
MRVLDFRSSKESRKDKIINEDEAGLSSLMKKLQ